MNVRRDVPLAGYTTFGVGGPARYLAEVLSEEDAARACGLASEEGLPLVVLGGGSNVLVSDEGFPGVVLLMRIRGISDAAVRTAPSSSGAPGPPGTAGAATFAVDVAAGEEWDGFVAQMVARGLGGVECLSGIPGTAGATPIQNVGAYGQEVGPVIERVRVFDREHGRFEEISGGECGFRYRGSRFTGAAAGRYIVTRVTFLLSRGAPAAVAYEDIAHALGSRPGSATLEDVRGAVLAVRRGKGMLRLPGDPEGRTAGSFFKNPVVSRDEFERLPADVGPPRPAQIVPGGRVKVPAARLIEMAGFRKGERRGNAAISSRHALALVSLEGASAREIRDLAREVRDRVRDRFGVVLQPEPVMLGFDDPF